METTNEPTLEEMSGETRSAPRLLLNELQFNGQKNNFTLILKKEGLVQMGDKKKYQKAELGESVSVIFLRIRRKLRQFRKGENPLTTNEHNTKHDMLTLFGDTQIIKGSNDELRERYTGLKTNQIVYCLLSKPDGSEMELVRLVVKGAALGSETKAKEVYDFYSYVSSFKEDGHDDHFYEYVTKLYGVPETSDLGSYYAMTFAKEEVISGSEEIMSMVRKGMKQVFDFVTQSDAYYQTKKPEELQKEKTAEKDAGLATIEYPEDDVDTEDIPF